MRSSQETRFLLPVAALSVERWENRGTAKEKREKELVGQRGVMTRKFLVLVVTGRRVHAPVGVIEQGALSCKAGSNRSTSVRKLGSAIQARRSQSGERRNSGI